MKQKTKYVILYYAVIFGYFFLVAGCKYTVSNKSPGDSQINQTATWSEFGELNPSAPKETIQLGQLIGEWDCISLDLKSIDADSSVWYSNRATWKWEYILGGHALLNNWWQEDTSPNPTTREYFVAGIFIFNPNTKHWEASVMNSRAKRISPKFQLIYKADQIQMHDGSGKWLVTFFDIHKDSFEWKYEILTEVEEWKPISKISAKRKS